MEPARLHCSICQIRYRMCRTRHRIRLILPSTPFLHWHKYLASQHLGVAIHIARLKALQTWDSRHRALRVIQLAKLIVLNLYQQNCFVGRHILQAICLSLLPYHRYDGISILQRNLLALYTKLAISRLSLSFGIRISIVIESNIRLIILTRIIHRGLSLELHSLATMVMNFITLPLMDRLWMRHGEMPV